MAQQQPPPSAPRLPEQQPSPPVPDGPPNLGPRLPRLPLDPRRRPVADPRIVPGRGAPPAVRAPA